MPKKKKILPKLEDKDLHELFGVKRKREMPFGEILEENLADQDLQVILKEKNPRKRPPSRRGQIASYPPPQEDLDLHGLTGPEAERKTVDFLKTANSLKLRSIRIITGKGLHSGGPAVLPDVVESRLSDLKSAGLIFDYRWEKKDKFKSGSVLVYLI